MFPAPSQSSADVPITSTKYSSEDFYRISHSDAVESDCSWNGGSGPARRAVSLEGWSRCVMTLYGMSPHATGENRAGTPQSAQGKLAAEMVAPAREQGLALLWLAIGRVPWRGSRGPRRSGGVVAMLRDVPAWLHHRLRRPQAVRGVPKRRARSQESARSAARRTDLGAPRAVPRPVVVDNLQQHIPGCLKAVCGQETASSWARLDMEEG